MRCQYRLEEVVKDVFVIIVCGPLDAKVVRIPGDRHSAASLILLALDVLPDDKLLVSSGNTESSFAIVHALTVAHAVDDSAPAKDLVGRLGHALPHRRVNLGSLHACQECVGGLVVNLDPGDPARSNVAKVILPELIGFCWRREVKDGDLWMLQGAGDLLQEGRVCLAVVLCDERRSRRDRVPVAL